jgi:hypothetical protein
MARKFLRCAGALLVRFLLVLLAIGSFKGAADFSRKDMHADAQAWKIRQEAGGYRRPGICDVQHCSRPGTYILEKSGSVAGKGYYEKYYLCDAHAADSRERTFKLDKPLTDQEVAQHESEESFAKWLVVVAISFIGLVLVLIAIISSYRAVRRIYPSVSERRP